MNRYLLSTVAVLVVLIVTLDLYAQEPAGGSADRGARMGGRGRNTEVQQTAIAPMEKEMDKTDVAGTWNLNVDLQGDSGTIVLTFQQKGKKLTGTYQGSLGEVDVTGTITGDQIEFTFEAEIVVVYKGTVDGDKMKGTCDYGGYVSGTFAGKREAKMDKTDVTGTWILYAEGGGNSGTPTFTFQQKGEKLTGTYQGSLGEVDVTGTIAGDQIEFTFEAEIVVVYKGTVDGDKMKGTCDYGGYVSGTFAGKREVQTDVTGTWILYAEGDGNSGTPTFTFQQKGENLTGTYQGILGEADVTGTITGDQIEFTFEAEIVVVYKGTVDGDEMKGTCDYSEYGSGTFTGKREIQMDKTDVTGTWILYAEGGGNSGTIVFTFQQKGEKLTGTYQGILGEADVTGTIAGDQVEFTFEAEIVVFYKGTVDGNEMKGTCDYSEYGSGTFTGKREAK